MQKWLDQNVTNRSANPTFGDHRALQPRQRLGAVGFLDDVERLVRRLCGIGRDRTWLHRTWAHRIGLHRLGSVASMPWRQPFPASPRPPGVGGTGFRGCLARGLCLRLIGEHGLRQRRRRLQSRQFERNRVGAIEFGLDEAARIGGRVDKIARSAAARTEAEAIERNQGCLRIAGHRSHPPGLNWSFQRLYLFVNRLAANILPRPMNQR